MQFHCSFCDWRFSNWKTCHVRPWYRIWVFQHSISTVHLFVVSILLHLFISFPCFLWSGLPFMVTPVLYVSYKRTDVNRFFVLFKALSFSPIRPKKTVERNPDCSSASICLDLYPLCSPSFSQTPSSLYALGNITAFCLLNVMDSVFSPLRLAIEIEYQYQHHWLAGTLLLALCYSLLYPSLPSFRTLLVSCFIGDFILFFLPKPVRVDASQHIKQKSTKRMSVWSRVKYIWHIMTKSNIKYLLFVFINVGIVPSFHTLCLGYGAITISGQITRHIRETQYVGIFMCIYSITDVIWSNVCGFLSDKYGSTLIIVLSVIAEVCYSTCGLFSSWLPWFFLLLATILRIILSCMLLPSVSPCRMQPFKQKYSLLIAPHSH